MFIDTGASVSRKWKTIKMRRSAISNFARGLSSGRLAILEFTVSLDWAAFGKRYYAPAARF